MALETVTVKLPRQVILSVDRLAATREVSREEAVVVLVKDGIQRQRSREAVLATHRRLRHAPQWSEAAGNIERFRSRVKRTSEAQLKEDIRETIARVRKENSV